MKIDAIFQHLFEKLKSIPCVQVNNNAKFCISHCSASSVPFLSLRGIEPVWETWWRIEIVIEVEMYSPYGLIEKLQLEHQVCQFHVQRGWGKRSKNFGLPFPCVFQAEPRVPWPTTLPNMLFAQWKCVLVQYVGISLGRVCNLGCAWLVFMLVRSFEDRCSLCLFFFSN